MEGAAETPTSAAVRETEAEAMAETGWVATALTLEALAGTSSLAEAATLMAAGRPAEGRKRGGA